MKRPWLLRLTAIAVGIVAGFVLLELGLRLAFDFPQPQFFAIHETLGLYSRPNADGYNTMEGRGHVTINSAGLRDSEFSIERNSKKRIVVLGDSFTQALQVDLQDTFHGLLEADYSHDIEIYSFGMAGYGTAQAYLAYETLAKNYDPDVVVLAFYPGNDIQDNSKELSQGYPRPYFIFDDGKLVLDTSFRNSSKFHRSPLIYSAYYFLTDNFLTFALLDKIRYTVGWNENSKAALMDNDSLIYGPQTRAETDAWLITELLIQKLAESVTRDGGVFVLFVLDSIPQQLDTKRDPFYVETRLGSLCRARSFLCVFMGPAAVRQFQNTRVPIHGFDGNNRGHWNKAGHQLAHDVLRQALEENGIISK